MKSIYVASICLLFASITYAVDMKGTCDVVFNATSTLHDFSGTVASKSFVATFEEKGEQKASAKVFVPVDKIDTKSKGRDKKMRKMFQSSLHPHIEGTVTDINPYAILKKIKDAGKTTGASEITLRIKNTEKKIPVSISNISEDEKYIKAEIRFDISVAAFKLKPPSVLGMIKVGDKIEVVANIKLEKSSKKLYFSEVLPAKPEEKSK